MYLYVTVQIEIKNNKDMIFQKPDYNSECVTLNTIKTGSQGKTTPALRPLPIQQMEHLTWVSG